MRNTAPCFGPPAWVIPPQPRQMLHGNSSTEVNFSGSSCVNVGVGGVSPAGGGVSKHSEKNASGAAIGPELKLVRLRTIGCGLASKGACAIGPGVAVVGLIGVSPARFWVRVRDVTAGDPAP